MGGPSRRMITTFANPSLNPGAKIVSGFRPIMPTFQGQVSEENLMALVAYIKSLAQPQTNGPGSKQASISGASAEQ